MTSIRYNRPILTCTFETGSKAFLRHVVTDGLMIKDSQILLVQRGATSPTEPGKFALPGGFLERDEDAEAGVKREVLEETGFQTRIVNLFTIIHTPRRKGDDNQNVNFVYVLEPINKIQGHDHEIDDVQWFDLDDLPAPEHIAFDHTDIINLYLKHLREPSQLPYINFRPMQSKDN